LGLAALVLGAACVHSSGEPIDADGDGVPAALDCDDANPATFRLVTTYPDADGDGYGVGGGSLACIGDAPPAGFALVGGDCAPASALAWRQVTSLPVDRDGDGVTAREAVDLCLGEAAPPPYLAVDAGTDCDDADPARWRWVVLYADRDGDGIGAGPRDLRCLGEALPAGFVRPGLDGDDADPTVGRTFDDDELLRLLD
jgi:hypothetical protein